MHNYEPGDEIYLFGFSRGAYTVRSLAGMIRNVGVLHKSAAERVGDACRLYRRRDAAPDSEEAAAFRAGHSREVAITFIGVWDTVGALGIPTRGPLGRFTARRHKFHDVELSGIVKHAHHVLAIDERRGPFRASLWQAKPKLGQIVEQVWFSGVHSDVGAASGDPSLSDAPYQWIKARASAAGLALNDAAGADGRDGVCCERTGVRGSGDCCSRTCGPLRRPNPVGASNGPGPLQLQAVLLAGEPSGLPERLRAAHLRRRRRLNAPGLVP